MADLHFIPLILLYLHCPSLRLMLFPNTTPSVYISLRLVAAFYPPFRVWEEEMRCGVVCARAGQHRFPFTVAE